MSLQTLDPVFIEFSLPQQYLGALSRGLQVTVSADAYPGKKFHGEITAIEPEIDQSTRNVRIQATMENKDGRLKPGMFVTVNIALAKSEMKLFIPASAVQFSPFGDHVYVIDEGSEGTTQMPGKSVIRRGIKLGVSKGDFVEVVEGLLEGERVISTGVFKIRPETRVVIDTQLAPEFSFAPTPDNT